MHADRGEHIRLGRGQRDRFERRFQTSTHPDAHERLDACRARPRQNLRPISREILGIQVTM